MRRTAGALVIAVWVLLASSRPPAAVAAEGWPALTLTALAHQFASITEIANAGDGSGGLYIVERAGTIRIIEADGSLRPGSFLDIEDKVGDSGQEQGLLGLAFSPRFASDGQFYVNYTDTSGDTVVERYSTNSPTDADEDSGEEVLFVDQPASNHNGGHLAFGPDGWLYIGMGDGGGGGDPQNHAQTDGDRLGKLLRFNPANGAIEAWAKGLRNPWKFSFDRETGDLYIADVGQNAWEEVSFVAAGAVPGLNFGWRIMEGSHCYPATSACTSQGLQLPVTEYSHAEGCSVTGGYVSREAGSEVNGVYVFGDYCSGTIWGLRRDSEGRWERTALAAADGLITTFGEAEDGTLFVAVSGGEGAVIHRLAAPPVQGPGLAFRRFTPGLAADR